MACLIPRAFHKDSWRKLGQTDQSDGLSTKSLLDSKSYRASDTYVTSNRKSMSIIRNRSNSTVLCRLILTRKYDAALRRLKKAPREASIWVVGGPTNYKTVHSRQLPIHMACSGLSNYFDDDPSRTQLELLVRQLALTFPVGCTHRDHDQQLPLHEALRHNASLDTISLLLIVAPESIDETDRYGRLPYEINCERKGDCMDEIAPLLRKDKHFWRSKREEFYAQPHIGTETYLIKKLLRLNCVLGGRSMGKDYVTILSQDSEPAGHLDNKAQQIDKHSDSKVSPKETCTPRSSSGVDSGDRPTILHEISRLQALKAEYARALADENLAKRVVKLEKEKSEMRLRINQMICVLKTQGLTSGDGRTVLSRGESGTQSMMAQTEDSSKNIRCGDHFKKPMIPSKVSMKENKRRPSRLSRQVSRAMKEEAMRDIVFVPNNYVNVHNVGFLPPGTTFERSQFSKFITNGSYNTHGAYHPMNVETQGTLENLLDMAEQRFGHTFSPGTIQAWRQISLPDSAKETARGSSQWVSHK